VIVSGVRALLLEKLCTARFWWGKGAIELPVVDYSRLRDEKALEAFEAINEHYYRYYLFYANMCVALLLLIASHIAAASEQAWSWPLFALLGVTLV
jgi:hypothetical protein